MRRGVVALAAVLLGVGVAQAAVDPNVQQWITDSDVAVPNDPYRGTVNIPGNGCLSPKEIAYSKAVLLPGHDAPIPTTTDHSTIENCIVALFYKELKKVYNASGTDPGPQLCPSDFDGVPWSFVTDTIAMFRPQCTDSPAQFVYAFT